jgi:hypothetical protein
MLSLNQILELKKNGVSTLSQLAIIKYCSDEPKSFQSISKDVNITIRGIERMIERESSLVRVVKVKKSDKSQGVGRPVSRALVSTAKAKKIIEKVNKVK